MAVIERLRWSAFGKQHTDSIWPVSERQAPMATAGERGSWPVTEMDR